MDYLTHGNDAYEASWAAQEAHDSAVDAAADLSPTELDFIRQLAALRSHPGANAWALEVINDYLISQAQEVADSSDEDIDWRDVLNAWTVGAA